MTNTNTATGAPPTGLSYLRTRNTATSNAAEAGLLAATSAAL
jgi:hypothetical protein